jgi:flagellar L-ring protein precursor FlgH
MRTILVPLFFALCSCAPTHVASYVPRQRNYAPAASTARVAPETAPGSLWRSDQAASMLFTDARALREQDLLVVKVEEIADAHRDADTDLSRRSDFGFDIAAFLRVAGLTDPALEAKLAAGLDSSFRGAGAARRTERLTATVPALVRTVLPNGNLFIEGHRVVLVNSEEHHFYISGVVRPIDIDQQNSIKSSMIADAEVEFTGRGNLTDNQRQGWLTRFFNWISPL